MRSPRLLTALATCAIGAGAAYAQQDNEVEGDVAAQASVDGANFPLTIFAARPTQRAFVSMDGGYDAARKAALVDMTVDVRLWGPLRLRGGGSYVSSADQLKPTAGLLVGFLNQDAHGLDATAGVFYKPEGLTEPEGEVEVLLSAGRRFGRLSLVGNVIYGQDPEGSERDAELRTGAIVRVGRRVLVGGDARLRLALGTPKGTEPDYDIVAGPLVTWLIGHDLALTAQAGASVVGQDGTKLGPVGILAMSRVF